MVKYRKMIIIAMVLITGGVFSYNIYTDAEINSQVIKVATHNIHGKNYLDVEAFNNYIASENINCIGMQEVDYDSNLPEIFYSETMNNSVVCKSDTSINNNMILSNLDLQNGSKISLPSANEERFLVKAEMTFNGKIISIYTTHFSYYEKEERSLQYAKLKEVLLEDENDYKIVMGDFNATSNSDYDVLKDTLYSLQGWNGNWYETNDDDQYKAIDNIFFTKNMTVNSVKCVEDKFGSDHRMMVVELILKK